MLTDKLLLVDSIMVGLYLAVSLLLGIFGGKLLGMNNAREEDYYLAGRKMPGWLNGMSVAATALNSDVAPLYCGIAVVTGISGCWFFLSRFGMALLLAAILFAVRWRQLGVRTGPEFFQLRFGAGRTFARVYSSLTSVLIGMVPWIGAGLIGIHLVAAPIFGIDSKAVTLLIVLPIGVGAAVYLNEYASNKKLIRVIEFTTETLAGIPSILYGLVGYLVFCQKLGLQTSLLSGCLTLTIMTLPTIIRTTQESLKTVPISYREGALGLGATKWHIVRTIVLPCSLDGIVTGCILAAGRVVGESAALLFTAGAGKLVAKSLLAAYSRSGASLAVALYLYVFEEGNFQVGYAIALVLLVLVTAINLAAKWARKALKQKT